MSAYKIARADDWGAVYRDGKKVYEGHDPEDQLAWMIAGTRVWNQRQVDRDGGYPDRLADVVSDEDWDDYDRAWMAEVTG